MDNNKNIYLIYQITIVDVTRAYYVQPFSPKKDPGSKLFRKFYFFMINSPIAMLWGLAKLIGGRAPSGYRQIWWADGVPIML